MTVQKGATAISQLNDDNNGGGGGNNAEITPLKSGTTFKVRVKSAQDLASYFAYSIFKKVYTFTPKNPAERNERGFITANPTPWDQAAQYLYDEAKQAEEDGEDKKAESLREEARQYKGKERFLFGFHDLTSGQDIVVDLTRNQAQSVYATIKEYEDDLGDMAFKLSKQGQSTSTTVALNPIVNLSKGLTDEERANFDASADAEFDSSLFDNVLYEADEAEQIENLQKAGFDVSLIGLAGTQESSQDKPGDENWAPDDDVTQDF